MTSLHAYVWNKKHILLSNVGSKHSLVMKLDFFKILIETLCDLENSSRFFCFFKNFKLLLFFFSELY